METSRTRTHGWLGDLSGQIDRLLRGEFARRDELLAEHPRGRVGTLVLAALLLGSVYGLCMGLFAVFSGRPDRWLQLITTTLKVPLLFLLTLVVTFPSLYVFSALGGARLRAGATLELAIAAVGLNLTVLASFGPVVAFFTASTKSYVFIKLLNVLFFAIAGVVSVRFLYRAFDAADEEDPGTAAPRTRKSARPRTLLVLWLVTYGAVGAQMGWVLRPFVGSPELPFELVRDRWSNFFADLWQVVASVFH